MPRTRKTKRDDGTYVSDGEGWTSEGSGPSSSGDTTVSPYSPLTTEHGPAAAKLEPEGEVGPRPFPHLLLRRPRPAAPP